MNDHKKPGIAFWMTVVVVVFLIPSAAYLGAYACLVEPEEMLVVSIGTYRPVLARYPELDDSPFWRSFFRPANWLDRKVRPRVWHEK